MRRAAFTSSARVRSGMSAILCSTGRDASQRCTVVARRIQGPLLFRDIEAAPDASASRGGEGAYIIERRDRPARRRGGEGWRQERMRRVYRRRFGLRSDY